MTFRFEHYFLIFMEFTSLFLSMSAPDVFNYDILLNYSVTEWVVIIKHEFVLQEIDSHFTCLQRLQEVDFQPIITSLLHDIT